MLDSAKINNLVKTCLGGLSARQKEVMEGRYGLSGSDTLTLAELGAKYNLTRERIRQIESIAIKTARAVASGDTFGDFVKTVSNYLKNAGGVKKEDLLIEGIAGSSQSNKLRFLLEMCGKFSYSKDSGATHPYWHLNSEDQKNLVFFVNYLSKNAERDNFGATFISASKNSRLSENVARNYASVSKKIGVNVYGEIGLSEWPEVNPRTARDWAYLVLKKEQKPLHFNLIAEKVTGLRGKKAHAPTIHNELIKDANFVLVGKGTYTLKEFGVVPGTARELIAHFLKENGPLKSHQIVDLVTKQRIFKENTILINLQNRKHFKRMDDGRYTTLV